MTILQVWHVCRRYISHLLYLAWICVDSRPRLKAPAQCIPSVHPSLTRRIMGGITLKTGGIRFSRDPPLNWRQTPRTVLPRRARSVFGLSEASDWAWPRRGRNELGLVQFIESFRRGGNGKEDQFCHRAVGTGDTQETIAPSPNFFGFSESSRWISYSSGHGKGCNPYYPHRSKE